MPVHFWVFLGLSVAEVVWSPVRIWYFKYTFDKAWDTLFDKVGAYAICCFTFYALS